MNEKTIRENIRRLLFEDNWVSYPTDDKAAGKFAIDADEMVDVPIAPAPQAAAQVSVDAPPVEEIEIETQMRMKLVSPSQSKNNC